MRSKRMTPVITALALLMPLSVAAGSPLWGQLEKGDHEIGFTSVEAYDYSRSFRPKYDYFGNPMEGERARPVQICIWYPATTDSADLTMTFGEYLFPNPSDPDFFLHASRLQNRYNAELIGILNGNQGLALDGLNMPVAAVRDATAAEGAFPLIIYHNGMGAYFDNFILCEYLASHGYAVAAVPSTGVTSYNLTPEATTIEYLTRDCEFALTQLQDIEYIDLDRVALAGLGAGGLSALLQACRSTGIEAVAAFDSWSLIEDHQDLPDQLMFLNLRELAVPILLANLNDTGRYIADGIDSMKYAERYVMTVGAPDPYAVTSHHILAAYMLDSTDHAESPVRPEYEELCRTTLAFFNLTLGGDTTATTRLASLQHHDAMKLPPTPEQFVQIIQQQGANAAADLYDEFQKTDPGAITAPERYLNLMGYRTMQSGAPEGALRLFKINAELHPASSNVWDSYADGCQTVGDTAQAIKCYEKVLQTLPDYDDGGTGLKETLRGIAEEGLARLRGETTESPDQGDM